MSCDVLSRGRAGTVRIIKSGSTAIRRKENKGPDNMRSQLCALAFSKNSN